MPALTAEDAREVFPPQAGWHRETFAPTLGRRLFILRRPSERRDPNATQAPKGTQDMLPADAHRWQKIDAAMRSVCALAGYREIRTPMFEHTELFARGVGDGTDVVQKEMYTFEDKGGRSITLKPEGTAGVARAFIEPPPVRRAAALQALLRLLPQLPLRKAAGGAAAPVPPETAWKSLAPRTPPWTRRSIALALDVLRACGIEGLSVRINSIGCPQCRGGLSGGAEGVPPPGKLGSLCKTCNERFERNPLRILDCKEDAHKLTDAPERLDYLCEDCRAPLCRPARVSGRAGRFVQRRSPHRARAGLLHQDRV